MQLIKQADLTQGWRARLYDTGEMQVCNGTTGETTWLPKESVDTLINICQEVKAETLAKKETN